MKIFRAFAVISAISVGFAQPARAQDAPKAEFGLGYQYMHDVDSSQDFPFGWVLSPGADVTSWLGLVFEVGGSYKTVSVGTVDFNQNVYTFLAGPKIMASSKAPVAPFVQVLFGGAHGSLSVGAPSVNLTFSGNHFAIQPGVGIDFNPSPTFGLRVEADGRGINTDSGTNKEWRLLAGVVLRR